MATAPTSPPNISTFPPAPNSATDTPSQFDTKANNFVSAQVSYVPEANSLSSWIESTATQVYGNALEAFNSASDAAASEANAADFADLAKNSSNFLGSWSSLTGLVDKGSVVEYENGRWQAVVDIADVTLSEPSLSNSDWLLIDFEKKSIPIADGVTLSSFAVNEIQGAQSNPIPLASSVPANTRLTISVPETFGGIKTTHLVSGSDTTTDATGVSDGFIFNWPNGGTITIVSDGVSNWRY